MLLQPNIQTGPKLISLGPKTDLSDADWDCNSETAQTVRPSYSNWGWEEGRETSSPKSRPEAHKGLLIHPKYPFFLLAQLLDSEGREPPHLPIHRITMHACSTHLLPWSQKPGQPQDGSKKAEISVYISMSMPPYRLMTGRRARREEETNSNRQQLFSLLLQSLIA